MRLVGRDLEQVEVARLLRDYRLVTLVGPGGVGKTALATAVAASAADQFPQGVRFIDLTLVNEPASVAAFMAARLGYSSFEALLGSPSDVPCLVVLDNCEHVIDAAAETVVQLLEACASPTVLATSRSPLNLPGEQVVLIGPLGQDDAVLLFEQRAAEAGADAIRSAESQAVDALCRALDGLPLAVELAAARMRSLSPAEILGRLEVEPLRRPRFRGPSRHRSLRATIEWSYDLLDAPERDVFDRLGVLSGDFTAGAAAAVTGRDVLDELDALVDASLVRADRHGVTTAYRQLEMIRSFAHSRLVDRGLLEETAERNVEFVVSELTTVDNGSWTASALEESVASRDQLLDALRWCISHDSSPERAFVVVGALWDSLHASDVEEVSQVCEAALERWEGQTSASWADAAATVASCRLLRGDLAGAASLCTSVRSSVEPSPRAAHIAARVLGQVTAAQGEFERARGHFREARHAPRFEVEMRLYEAVVIAAMGRRSEALDVVVTTETASEIAELWKSSVRAHLLLPDSPADARMYADVALRRANELGYAACAAVNLHTLAAAELAEGRTHEASVHAVDLLAHVARRGAHFETRAIFDICAAVLRAAGRVAWRRLAAAVAALPRVDLLDVRRDGPADRVQPEPLAVREALLLARAELEAVQQTPHREGSSLSKTAAPGVFRLIGETFEIGYMGRPAQLKPSKGLTDLSRLLAQPGVELHCTELADVGVDQSSAGPLIDPEARRAYESRIRELRSELDEAEADNDIGRVEFLRAEYDAIVEHLAAATGLGGRSRQAGVSNTERARSTVTQRIRSSMRRIAAVHPELGRHLEVSVTTGTYCKYAPERDQQWITS
ncbi:hypothetical protein E1218_04840 [Kribbella turkmenica]|uniref:Uncharacterized protein n=1 Tax=Kribbella turkmenica TaxID=2530375 RepID=A0A4V2YH43_9ACTN|nr:PhoH family protein [Kribbella turkmenica]TDD29197.1 hypothetical protein E1218_04840 [Kribbella turkmenica]